MTPGQTVEACFTRENRTLIACMASPHAGCGVTICRRERRPGAGARSPPLLRHHRHPFWRFYEKRRFNDYFTYSAYVEPYMPKNRCTSCTLTHSPMDDPAPRRGGGNSLLPQPRPLRISPQGGSTGVSEPVWIKTLGVLRGILSLDKARRGRESRFTTDEQRRPGSKGPQPGGVDLSLGEASLILIP